MSKTAQYQAYKTYLKSLNLPPDEFERKLREWCIKNKY